MTDAEKVMEMIQRLRALTGWASTEACDKYEKDVRATVTALVAERDEAVRRAEKAEEAIAEVLPVEGDGHPERFYWCAFCKEETDKPYSFPHASDCIVREIIERKSKQS